MIVFSAKELPVRDTRFVDEMTPRLTKHTGWFADADGYGDRGTVRGFVARVSHGRFLAGHYWSENDEYLLIEDDLFDNERDAAQSADEAARIYAESLQEDDARFQAMTAAESLVVSLESDVREAFENRHKDRKARAWVLEVIENLRGARDDYEQARKSYERS